MFKQLLLLYDMKKQLILILIVIISLSYLGCEAQTGESKFVVKTGAKVLIQKHLDSLEGKRVGLVMNHSARVDGVHMLDTLLALNVDITALFAPEHGFRGDAGAGEIIKNGVDQATNLPVYSLYGTNRKPTNESMNEVDILLFDMQDVGARFYTYNSTLKNVLEAAADNGKEVWVLDRPNPAGGDYVSGWILEEEFKSFVGVYPMPVAHGLTLGELANMAIYEQWLETSEKPDLKIIKMEGWVRSMKWADTGLTWLAPSPNLPSFEHAYVYLGTCFVEGTTLSEGRGTPDPFLTLGSPSTNISPEDLYMLESKYHVKLDTLSFTPVSIPGKSLDPKHKDEQSFGIRIQTTPAFDDPVSFGVELLYLLMENSQDANYVDYLYLLSGSREIDVQNLTKGWGKSFDEFVQKREQYLLY